MRTALLQSGSPIFYLSSLPPITVPRMLPAALITPAHCPPWHSSHTVPHGRSTGVSGQNTRAEIGCCHSLSEQCSQIFIVEVQQVKCDEHALPYNLPQRSTG